MAPHAISPVRAESQLYSGQNEHSTSTRSQTSCTNRTMIPRSNEDDLHDIICVGFGPASLAIAAALHDKIELEQRSAEDRLGARLPKVAFIEKQSTFRWHAGMQLPGAKMQISWIKDFATLRNPRSSFTFLNYLWSVGRLAQFSNLGTFLPTRLEYEAYMKWIAARFDHLVEYSHECVEILPQKPCSDNLVQSFIVKIQDVRTGQIETRGAKHVIVSCGGRAHIPSHFPQDNPQVIHSSSYARALPKICPNRDLPYRFAVIGSGQSAAETFHDLQSRYPNCRTSMLIKQAALKPSDDSPFVNETFDPEHVDHVFATDEVLRQIDIQNDKSTNYGVVRLELLEEIYQNLYLQRVKFSDSKDWQHQVLPFREVESIEQAANGLRVLIKNSEPLHQKGDNKAAFEVMPVDAVIVATGYERDSHETLMRNMRDLSPDTKAGHRRWKVRRDYSVIFKSQAISSDSGIWLQGSNESTHGLSDTLLSILAVRSKEVVDAIFSKQRTSD